MTGRRPYSEDVTDDFRNLPPLRGRNQGLGRRPVELTDLDPSGRCWTERWRTPVVAGAPSGQALATRILGTHESRCNGEASAEVLGPGEGELSGATPPSGSAKQRNGKAATGDENKGYLVACRASTPQVELSNSLTGPTVPSFLRAVLEK